MPNIWNADGTPAVGFESDPEYVPYQQQLRWEPELKGHGYRGIPQTPADDFEPWTTIDDDLEELI